MQRGRHSIQTILSTSGLKFITLPKHTPHFPHTALHPTSNTPHTTHTLPYTPHTALHLKHTPHYPQTALHPTHCPTPHALPYTPRTALHKFHTSHALPNTHFSHIPTYTSYSPHTRLTHTHPTHNNTLPHIVIARSNRQLCVGFTPDLVILQFTKSKI